MSEAATLTRTAQKTEHFDVLIVGAGIAGVGGAYHMAKERPGSSFVVLDVQDYNGFIFGGPNTDQWTQMVRQRGYKFENPLHQNSWRLQIIRAFVKDTPLIGKVVFSSVSQFPKGIPEGVLHVSTLSEDLAQLADNKEIPEMVRKAWDKLSTHAIDARSPDWKKIR